MNKYDLFIGAYVIYVGEVYVVRELYHYTCKIENPNWCFTVKHEYLNPIPLGKEILESFGFKECFNGKVFSDSLFSIQFRGDKILFFNKPEKNEFTTYLDIKSTNYVHDLQRAYFIYNGKCLEKRLGTN